MRHPILRDFDPRRGISVATLAYDYPSGFLVPEHGHDSDQLIYATSGLMEVHSGQSVWLIPPSFALLVPARLLHRIRMPVAVSMRTLYFRPGLVERSAATCEVISISPLLRELIVEAVRIGQLRMKDAEHCAIRDLAALHVARARSIPVEIRLPTDARASKVASMLLNSLADAPSLQAICKKVGVSTRTLQRLFKSEVGVDADSWRHQVRLIRAMELLISNNSVKQAASAVGYSQPSAFVAAFRRTFGITPKMWRDRVCKVNQKHS